MNAKKEVPVLLLTGYLGSGKTTLLNKILANEKGIKFAVIVNDIGEVNIDAALIEKGGVVGQKDDSLVSINIQQKLTRPIRDRTISFIISIKNGFNRFIPRLNSSIGGSGPSCLVCH